MSVETKIVEFLKQNFADYSPKEHVVAVRKQPDAEGFDVQYHTVYDNDALQILEILQDAEVAPLLSKVEFTSEDEGVNGTQYWDLKALLNGKRVFKHLESIAFPLNAAGTHNRIIITHDDMYGEKGGLGLLLDQCPQLQSLSAPSAPNEGFFARKSHGLKTLHIQTGYAHQDFIQNLGSSTCFPALSALTFRDYAETYMENFKASCTPYAAYDALMQSKGLPALKHVVLYDTVLSAKEQDALVKVANAKGRQLEFRSL